eukprot:10576487-Lingulodinium_polyedra.AAC.1
MGSAWRASTRMCLHIHVAKTIINASGWLAIQSPHFVGTPVACGALHCGVTPFYDVSNMGLGPN